MYKIDKFAGHFKKEIEQVFNLRSGCPHSQHDHGNDPLLPHKKALYCSIIDALAAIRFGKEETGNRVRFTELLRLHSDWQDGNLISTAILAERLPPDAPQPLRRKIEEILNSQPFERGGSFPLASLDRPLEIYSALPSSNNLTRILKRCRHFDLFYDYRNSLLHEFRQPGYAMEVFADGGHDAVYHSYIGERRWRLVYPLGLFKHLACACLSSLESYFEENGINPYERVKRSETWAM